VPKGISLPFTATKLLNLHYKLWFSTNQLKNCGKISLTQLKQLNPVRMCSQFICKNQRRCLITSIPVVSNNET